MGTSKTSGEIQDVGDRVPTRDREEVQVTIVTTRPPLPICLQSHVKRAGPFTAQGTNYPKALQIGKFFPHHAKLLKQKAVRAGPDQWAPGRYPIEDIMGGGGCVKDRLKYPWVFIHETEVSRSRRGTHQRKTWREGQSDVEHSTEDMRPGSRRHHPERSIRILYLHRKSAPMIGDNEVGDREASSEMNIPSA